MVKVTLYAAVAASGIAAVMGFMPAGGSIRPQAGLQLRGPASQHSASCARRQQGVALRMSDGDRKAEIEEVLKELEDFREKIVDQSKMLAKKVKAKPKDLKKALEEHPDIIKIDQAKEQLEAELKQMAEA
jgi:hypothetical protein